MSKAKFRLESHRAHTLEKVAELPFSNLQAEFFINKEDNLRFTLPSFEVAREDFYPGIHEAWLFRNDKLIFSGPFWSATVVSDQRTLSCECQSLLSYLSEREIRKYNDTDYQDNVAWDVIERCQQGYFMDLGIIRGVFSNKMAKQSLTIQPWQPRKVLDIVSDLAANTGRADKGFDFDISANRAFNCWFPHKGVDTGEVLQYGKEIRTYSDQVLARSMVTDLRLLGSGSGSKQYFEDLNDPNSAQRFWGMQSTMSYTAAKNRTDLKDKAQFDLESLKSPKVLPGITIDTDQIDFDPFESIGDIFRIVIDDGWAQYDRKMRQAGMQLTVGANFSEQLTWYLNDLREVVDA